MENKDARLLSLPHMRSSTSMRMRTHKYAHAVYKQTQENGKREVFMLCSYPSTWLVCPHPSRRIHFIHILELSCQY